MMIHLEVHFENTQKDTCRYAVMRSGARNKLSRIYGRTSQCVEGYT